MHLITDGFSFLLLKTFKVIWMFENGTCFLKCLNSSPDEFILKCNLLLFTIVFKSVFVFSAEE